jgi:Tfp pilus assembly protein PilX
MKNAVNKTMKKPQKIMSDGGIALVLALIITTVVIFLVLGTLYVITQGTSISGSRKVYKTACEAADGAVELSKDAIEKVIANLPIPGQVSYNNQGALFGKVNDNTNAFFNQNFDVCLNNSAVYIDNASCPTTVTLPALMGSYTANVTITRMYAKIVSGGSPEFPPRASGSNSAIFYRIDASVTGEKNVQCQNAAVYKHMN